MVGRGAYRLGPRITEKEILAPWLALRRVEKYLTMLSENVIVA
jgi:hypothetical protein